MADDIPQPAGTPDGNAPPNAIAAGTPAPATPPATAISSQPMNVPTPDIAKPKPPAPQLPKKDTEVKDTFRELIETIVFVVVLVLMLKTFLAEAFVIPTGSMADTLLGYHYKETCKDCGKTNLINASAEAEPPEHQGRPRITGYKCANCGHINPIPDRRGGQP
jgi:hypothetical protein